MRNFFLWTALLLVPAIAFNKTSADELTLLNATTPEPNSAQEPFAKSFSLASATQFLDQASLNWTQERKCFTCHTNYSYLIARPCVTANVKAHQQVRDALEKLVEVRWQDSGPRWDAEVIMSAAVLAINDSMTTGKLHDATRKALDRVWSLQRDDGGFDWLKCDWPPMESDDEYGAAMALIAVGAAPDGYAQTKQATEGVKRLKDYLKNNPPPTVHHKAMFLWADSYEVNCLTAQQRDTAIQELRDLQKKDGGWSLATLGDWERGDDKEQDTQSSDGYATGFVTYVLRRAGVSADDPQLQNGIAWLKSNQRSSGRWFTRSLFKDSKHYISHAGTAFAVLAITSCDAPSPVHTGN